MATVTRPAASAALALVLGLFACSEAGAPPETDDPTKTSGRNADSIALVEELRFGGLTGPEAETFGYVGAVAPAPDGGVYVSDIQIPLIRRYDAEGTHVADVGRGGQGPGEYGQIAVMRVLDDGRLAIFDPMNMRLTYFDPDGTLDSDQPLSGFMGSYEGFVFDPAGGGWGWWVDMPEGGLGAVERDDIPLWWARVDDDGTPAPVHRFPPEDREGPRYVLSGRGGFYRPFNVMNLHALGPGGTFYQARNDEYRIRKVTADGVESFLTRDEPRIRLTDDEVREWTARSESMANREGQTQPRSDFFPIPDTKPYIRSLLVDADGRLWVSRYTEAVHVAYSDEERAERAEQGLPDYTWRDRLQWDVWGADGTFIGEVTLPQKTSLSHASGDVVWGVQQGAYREDYVVKFRVQR